MSIEKEVKIKQVTNGYILTFGILLGWSTEVHEKFEDVIKELKKYFGEE